ncbi:MAG: UDP-3-O-(3-hydroxymyristoyl)glucosamine N-acyltransferase [Marinoscillum sp.]|uniref:UDP-3-O-(3-hydroxymyristoyl)glucosamine N-acyltransferase n=1 Tax=Marinoscillum sp. TaxID=2024838 RepID=UPI0032F41B55
MNLTVGQIAEILNGEVTGDPNTLVTNISSLEDAQPDSVSFLANPKYQQHLYRTRAAAAIVSDTFIPKHALNTSLIRVNDPYLSFTALQAEYQRLSILKKTGIESPAHMGAGVTYSDGFYLGAFAYIGDHVTIGKNVKIYPQVHIGDHCKIGDHTIIYPGAKIYERTVIGAYCNIQAGAVIGSHGFGFAPRPDGSYQNIPQMGNVKLGDHVDIGANTTIDCATLGTTYIEDGVKIDNLVQIAHNVEIGKDTVIAAQTGISGSAKVGKHVMIGGQVGTVGHIHIADHTKVGARSGVTKSTKSDQILFGVPAMDRQGYLKSYAIYKKLPEVMVRIQELEQKILNLTPNSPK